jgi:outer membrane protein OmpA-like peptidoglycan-associated protein
MEFAPTYFKDGIIYCSNKKARVFSNYFDENDNRITDIHYWNDSLKTSTVEKEMNTKVHEGPVDFTDNGDTMFSTQNQRSNLTSFNSLENPLGLFLKVRNDGKWSKGTKLPFVDPGFSYAHPSYQQSRSRLFFSSNMDGGHGGMDLYYTDLVNGQWSEPINLGNKINSPRNEVFPFIDESGDLYFSTDFYSDSSDLDIYSTILVDDAWSNLIKLNQPINSPHDDFSYVSNSAGGKGYFASNRGGNDDIYSFTYRIPNLEDCEEIHKPNLCWEFTEERAADLDSIPIVYQWTISTGDTLRGLTIDYCFPDTGYYEIALSLYDTITGSRYMNVGEYAVNIEAFNRPYIESSDKTYLDSSIVLKADVSGLVDYEILEYLWDLGNGEVYRGKSVTYTPSEEGIIYPVLGVVAIQKKTRLKESLCAYKVIEVLKNNETDNVNLIESSDENELDSKEETEVSNDSMIYVVQLFETETLYESEDSIFGALKNKVYPRYMKDKKAYSYDLKYANDISSLYDDFAKAIELGFDKTILQQIAKNALSIDSIFFKRLNNETLVNLINSGALDNVVKKDLTIYFDNDSYSVDTYYQDAIKSICSNVDENTTFLIQGYADAIGEEDYNLDISEKRAKAIAKELYKFGANKNRTTFVWFGEKFAVKENEKELKNSDRKVKILILN